MVVPCGSKFVYAVCYVHNLLLLHRHPSVNRRHPKIQCFFAFDLSMCWTLRIRIFLSKRFSNKHHILFALYVKATNFDDVLRLLSPQIEANHFEIGEAACVGNLAGAATKRAREWNSLFLLNPNPTSGVVGRHGNGNCGDTDEPWFFWRWAIKHRMCLSVTNPCFAWVILQCKLHWWAVMIEKNYPPLGWEPSTNDRHSKIHNRGLLDSLSQSRQDT